MWHASLSPEQVQVGGRDPLTSFSPTPDTLMLKSIWLGFCVHLGEGAEMN